MKIKSLIITLFMAVAIMFVMPSCNKKVADADVKAKVESAVSHVPGVIVDVNNGIVTLSGEVADDASKMQAASSAEALKADKKSGVKGVVNNLTIAPPAVMPASSDQVLTSAMTDALKDFPTVQATVNDGVITVTGELKQSRVKTLKQILDGLNPKKVDMTGLTIK